MDSASGGPALLSDVVTHCPEFLDLARIRFRPLALAAAARCLDLVALRALRARAARAEALADELGETADAIASVLRELTPVLVAARFAKDSPLRSVSGSARAGEAG